MSGLTADRSRRLAGQIAHRQPVARKQINEWRQPRENPSLARAGLRVAAMALQARAQTTVDLIAGPVDFAIWRRAGSPCPRPGARRPNNDSIASGTAFGVPRGRKGSFEPKNSSNPGAGSVGGGVGVIRPTMRRRDTGRPKAQDA